MTCINSIRASVMSLTGVSPMQPHFKVLCSLINGMSTFHHIPLDRKPCFDMRNVSIIRGSDCHVKMITFFMNTQYWPREPSVIALWMPLNSSYLEFLTAKFANSGERLLAMEYLPRTGERKLIGFTVASRVYPWMIADLKQWGHITDSTPERNRMYFCAHCLTSANLFEKYNVDYIYDIEALGTAAEVTGQGVGTCLLKKALDSAYQQRHALVQVIAVNNYANRICEKNGMKLVWSMDYRDFIDHRGQSVFFPRTPHQSVNIYVKYFDPKKGGVLPCKPAF